MQARKALRPLQGRADGRDREGRSVGGQRRVGAQQAFKLAQQRLFGVQALYDGLHDQVAVGQRCQGVHRSQFPGESIGLGCVDVALLHHALPLQHDAMAGRLRHTWLGIEQQHLAAGLNHHLRNAAPHGTSAHQTHHRK